MSIFETIMHKILIFEKEPQKIGLSQLKDTPVVKQNDPSIKNKNVKFLPDSSALGEGMNKTCLF